MTTADASKVFLVASAALASGYMSCPYEPPRVMEYPLHMWRRGLLPSRYGLQTPSRGRRGR